MNLRRTIATLALLVALSLNAAAATRYVNLNSPTRNYWLERATNLGAAPIFQTIATNPIPYFYQVACK